LRLGLFGGDAFDAGYEVDASNQVRSEACSGASPCLPSPTFVVAGGTFPGVRLVVSFQPLRPSHAGQTNRPASAASHVPGARSLVLETAVKRRPRHRLVMFPATRHGAIRALVAELSSQIFAVSHHMLWYPIRYRKQREEPSEPPFHVYARTMTYSGPHVEFYQIT